MRRLVALTALAAALLSTSAAAFLCTRTPDLGPSVFWLDRTIVVRPNGGGREIAAGELERVLQRGAATWSGTDCSDIRVEVGPSTLQEWVGFNWHAGSADAANQNIVLFRNDTPGDELDRWLHDASAIAITTVTFDARSGRLLDADIEINDIGFEFTSCDSCDVKYDLENTLTHELGHVLGLDHPPAIDEAALEATMRATAAQGDTDKRDLGIDDVNGICAIYPIDSANPGECFDVGRQPPSTVTFSQGCRGADVTPLAGVLVVLGAVRRTRRRTAAASS